MKGGKNAIVKAVIPEFLKNKIQQATQQRGDTESSLIGKIIIDHIGEYLFLSPLEKRFIDEKKKSKQADMLKFIRSRSAERLNFVKNIKKQFQNFTFQKELGINKAELLKNLELNQQIAQVNEWKEEEQMIAGFVKIIKDYKNGVIDLKPLGVLQHEKQKEIYRKEENKIYSSSGKEEKNVPDLRPIQKKLSKKRT